MTQPSSAVVDRGGAGASTTSSPSKRTTNVECRWDRFNPEWYFKHNYDHVRPDDEQLLTWVRDVFLDDFRLTGRDRHGIDIGPGANLYPALAMLPFCRTITLCDFAEPNVGWLKNEITSRFRRSWLEFWGVLTKREAYRTVRDPHDELIHRAEAVSGSIFDLPEGKFDLGTMFFVAESITSDEREFEDAVQRFVRCVRPRAPFAAAFMKGSVGYQVDAESYPAVAIDSDRVTRCLESVAYDVNIRVIELHEAYEPVRDGYEGMILATGRRSAW